MDLIVGSSSQISHYLPCEMQRVSSRDIPEEIFEKQWESVYLTFAEQRTRYAADKNYREDFYRVNVDMTLSVARRLRARRIIYYSTVELWSSLDGAISLETPFDFVQNYYTDSKHVATEKLRQIENVKVLFPFNFNSIYRSEDYLFGKIFSSVRERKIVEVGNLDMKRDILHAKWVAEQSLLAKEDRIIGSGTYYDVRKFVRDVYAGCGLDPDKLLVENGEPNRHNRVLYLGSEKILYNYETLLRDTINDIENTARQRHYQQL